MLAAIWVFKSNLANVAGRRLYEIGVFNAILPTTRHTDDEWLKRDNEEQVANTLFHRSNPFHN